MLQKHIDKEERLLEFDRPNDNIPVKIPLSSSNDFKGC